MYIISVRYIAAVDWWLMTGSSPPQDVRAIVPTYGNHGDVLVTWKYEACRLPDEGYVIGFELIYCQLDSDEQCIGRWNSSIIIFISLSLSVLTAIFHVNLGSRYLLKQRMTEVLVTDNWTTGAISRAKLQSNDYHQQTNIQFFYRPVALPVAQPTVSKHWREKYHIPWTCLPQAHLGSSSFVCDH